MSLALFNAVPAGTIETLFDDQNQPWLKRAYVGKFLEITDIKASTKSEELREEMRERLTIPTGWITPPWSGPKDQQNKTDIFLSVYGAFYVIVRSKKPKRKELREWVMRDIIPRGLNDKIKELKDKHDEAIEDMTRRIEAIQLESENDARKRCSNCFVK